MIWLALGLIVAAFVGGLVLGRKSSSLQPTGAPTDPSAAVDVPTVVEKVEAASQQATADAQTKAEGIKHASVADLMRRADELRERGRSGK